MVIYEPNTNFDKTNPDTLQSQVLSGLALERRGTRMSLEEIAQKRKISDSLKTEAAAEADKLVRRRHIFSDPGERSSYVFSKDENGNYYWREATRLDKFLNGFYSLIGLYQN